MGRAKRKLFTYKADWKSLRLREIIWLSRFPRNGAADCAQYRRHAGLSPLPVAQPAKHLFVPVIHAILQA
jgi:hypothetical protein